MKHTPARVRPCDETIKILKGENVLSEMPFLNMY